MKKLTIAVDFDGTIASERYPDAGILMYGSKERINQWYDKGHIIIINTCRADDDAERARQFLIDNGVKFHFFNENDPKRVARYGNDPRKIGGDIYIDDRNIGTIIDWDEFDRIVKKMESQKPLMIAIVGRSGSGKTTIAEYIEKKFGIVMIQSHTDRPKRHENENGHVFHTKEEFDKFKHEDMIAFTDFGSKRYCCLKSDTRNRNTYVIDERGLRTLLNNEDYDVVSIRLLCGSVELERRAGLERMKRDEGMFTMDIVDFNYRIRTDIGIDYTESCVDRIITKILQSRM